MPRRGQSIAGAPRPHRSGVVSGLLARRRQIVTGSMDQTIRVWDITSGQELRIFKGHTDEVCAVAVTPDGRDIASASDDDGTRLGRHIPPRPRVAPEPLRAHLRRAGGMPGVQPRRLACSFPAMTTTPSGSGTSFRMAARGSEGSCRNHQVRGVQPRRPHHRLRAVDDKTVRIWDAAIGQHADSPSPDTPVNSRR